MSVGTDASTAPSALDTPDRPVRICVTCRTLYGLKEDCPGKHHKTVSLITHEGRQALDNEVWGPDSRARAMRQAAKAGAGGGAASGLDWCGGGCSPLDACDGIGAGGEIGGLIVGVIVMIIGAIIAVVLFFAIRALVRWLREKLRKPVPHGALQGAPKLKRGVLASAGVVRSGHALDTPWRVGKAYAWALELHEKMVLGGGAMLRDARTAGFTLQLDDGRHLRVPPGRIRVMSPLVRVDADRAKLAETVTTLEGRADHDRTLFPFDFARAVTIEEGDRVEVLGELTLDSDAEGGGGYREGARLIPVGVPYLRVEKAERIRIAPEPTLPPAIGGVAEAEAEALEEQERKAQR